VNALPLEPRLIVEPLLRELATDEATNHAPQDYRDEVDERGKHIEAASENWLMGSVLQNAVGKAAASLVNVSFGKNPVDSRCRPTSSMPSPSQSPATGLSPGLPNRKEI
jgi:hypothetical protein